MTEGLAQRAVVLAQNEKKIIVDKKNGWSSQIDATNDSYVEIIVVLIRAFHNLAFSEFLCSMGVLLFLFMMWNYCNFFRFLKLILDHPHGGQRSQRSVCTPENANFFIYWVTELIFVSKDFIFQDNQFDIQEVENPFINKKVYKF